MKIELQKSISNIADTISQKCAAISGYIRSELTNFREKMKKKIKCFKVI